MGVFVYIVCGFSVNICTQSNDLSSFGKRCLADLNCCWAAEGSQASSLRGDPFMCSGTDTMTALLCQCLTSVPSLAAWDPSQAGSVCGGTQTCMGRDRRVPEGVTRAVHRRRSPSCGRAVFLRAGAWGDFAHTPSAALLLPKKVRHPGLAFW